MTYFRVDDKFWSHPKLFALGMDARGLWITAGSFCASYLTDGFIADEALQFVSCETARKTKDLAQELVENGLWDRTENGYQFRDWEHHNYTKEQVVAQQERRRKNQASYRNRQEMKAMLRDVNGEQSRDR